MSLNAFEEKKHSVHLDLCQLSYLDDCIAVDRFECIAGLATVEGGVQRFQLVDLEHAPLKKYQKCKRLLASNYLIYGVCVSYLWGRAKLCFDSHPPSFDQDRRVVLVPTEFSCGLRTFNLATEFQASPCVPVWCSVRK